jgi:hypothetical protein
MKTARMKPMFPLTRRCSFAYFVAGFALAVFPSASSAQSVLGFDRDDPSLVAFRQQPVAAAPPQGTEALALPVLGLTAAAPVPAGAEPVLVTDVGRNPNWYSIVYDRGDVKISVTGDRNYQDIPVAARLPDAPAEQFNLASADDPQEPVAAQVTLYRFPRIPYVVDVICKSAAVYQLCRSEAQLRTLIASIGVLAAPR